MGSLRDVVFQVNLACCLTKVRDVQAKAKKKTVSKPLMSYNICLAIQIRKLRPILPQGDRMSPHPISLIYMPGGLRL